MKKRPVALALCLLMLLSLLSACDQEPAAPAPTDSPAPSSEPTPEPTPAPTTEEDRRKEWEEWNRIQQENGKKLYGDMLVMQDEMIAFFLAHQEEFENFAFLLHDLDASDPDCHYLYAVESNSLFFFDETSYRAKGEITDHPILASGEFLRDSRTILFVEWLYSSRWFEQEEICCFGAQVPDELNDGIYAELYIFYSENEPGPNEYQQVTELAPHWYYYDEYKE